MLQFIKGLHLAIIYSLDCAIPGTPRECHYWVILGRYQHERLTLMGYRSILDIWNGDQTIFSGRPDIIQ